MSVTLELPVDEVFPYQTICGDVSVSLGLTGFFNPTRSYTDPQFLMPAIWGSLLPGKLATSLKPPPRAATLDLPNTTNL